MRSFGKAEWQRSCSTKRFVSWPQLFWEGETQRPISLPYNRSFSGGKIRCRSVMHAVRAISLPGGTSMESRQSEEPAAAAAAASGPMFLSMLTNLLRDALLASADQHPPSSSQLPANFCSALLQEDPSRLTGLPPQSCDYDQFVEKGLPLYPLYKQLAKSLQVWISTGLLPRSLPECVGLAEERICTTSIDGWNLKIAELGSTLVKLLQRANFQMHVQEPYYSLLKDGMKTVEGRCNSGFYKRIQAGDFVLFNQTLLLEVTAVSWYPTFETMLLAEDISKVLPGMVAVAEGVQVYRRFYSEEHELQHGALALHVTRFSVLSQPTEVMQMLLNELSVEGLRALLGLRRTTGSDLDLLPPPRSTLISSFTKLAHESTPTSLDERTKGKSKLTVGARALAKHASRSSSGWWGVCSGTGIHVHAGGTEISKNEQALSVVLKILDHATWINIHHLPPAFPTFEVRVAEGYGSRWSADGTEFRGFLEPPMEEGHQKKWKH